MSRAVGQNAVPLTASLDRAIPLVLWLLVLANIFDMGGVFGIKYLSYAVAAVLLGLRLHQTTVSAGRMAVVVGVFLLWPMLSLFHGLAQGAALREAIGEVTPFMPGLLTYLLLSGTQGVRPLEILMGGLVLLAIATSLIFGLLLLAPDSGATSLLLSVMGEEGHGYFGVRELGAVVIPNVYFKATLFLVPAFAWFLFRRQLVPAGICILGLVLAFSRAGLALAAVVLLGFMLIGSARQRLVTIAFVVTAGALIFYNAELLHVAEYLGRVQDAFLGRDDSSQARIGHLGSLVDIFNRDALKLWFGHGAGTSFFSEGAGGWVTDIELDHLDAIRQFGLVWFVLFAGLVLAAVRAAMQAGPDGLPAAIALGVAFIASGTNPVLINPLFMIMLAMVARLGEAGGPGRVAA